MERRLTHLEEFLIFDAIMEFVTAPRVIDEDGHELTADEKTATLRRLLDEIKGE